MPYIRIHCNLCGKPAEQLGNNVNMMKVVDELGETLQVCFACVEEYIKNVRDEAERLGQIYVEKS